MSKVDAQRAMREARYAAMQAQAQQRPARRPAPVAASAAPPPAPAAAASCGHRDRAGRTCVRPAGHAEKSHRYA